MGSDLAGTKGGSGVWQRIVSEMPLHRVYIEPFWGRGTIARQKRWAEYTIGCDLDPAAISDGRVLGALMFQTCGLGWLRDYFAAQPGRVATFGGAAWLDHFVYLDPPYLGCSGYYRHELSEQQHVELCRLFMALPCPAAMSGYMTELHRAELRDARATHYHTTNRAGRKVTEYLWLNYEPPAWYHDVRYVGGGRRQRERIRRRRANWSSGLEHLSPPERQAILEACAAACGVAVRPSRLPATLIKAAVDRPPRNSATGAAQTASVDSSTY